MRSTSIALVGKSPSSSTTRARFRALPQSGTGVYFRNSLLTHAAGQADDYVSVDVVRGAASGGEEAERLRRASTATTTNPPLAEYAYA